MNINIGKKINEGVSSDIFEWENNKKIIKLAKFNKKYKAIVKEYLNTKLAWNNGVSVPQPFDLVEVDGRLGIIFERIHGETLMERFIKRKGLNYEEIARITAKTLSETHKNKIHNSPSQREPIIYSINQADYLTVSDKKLAVEILNSIPIKQRLCHGDPNMNNILIADNKALLIDWGRATIGNPEADLAEYILMTRYAMLPMVRYAVLPRNVSSKTADYINSIKEKMIKVFIDEYTKLSDITYKDIDSWIVPIIARRLSSGIIPEDEKELLVDEFRRRIKKYK